MDKDKKKKKEKKAVVVQEKSLGLFSHLTPFSKEINYPLQGVHPAVYTLGLQFSENVIAGGNSRCLAMLQAFKTVISDYVTPFGTSLSRHLHQHISKQVDFLSHVRSLAASMKTAIRFLKQIISKVPIELPDQDAKNEILNEIDDFIRERITLADNVLIKSVFEQDKIKDGDVLLIYGKSSLVLRLLMEAKQRGLNFRVIVVSNKSHSMLRSIVKAGIPCTFVLTSALPIVIKEVTKCFISASSVLSNGYVLSCVGTAVVCMMCYEYHIPVLCLCETYKFSEVVRLDSFVWNELGDPDALASESLKDWQQIPNLKLINLQYDVTPAKYITMLVTEFGFMPSTSALTCLRHLHQ